jgi:hypothetical protein
MSSQSYDNLCDTVKLSPHQSLKDSKVISLIHFRMKFPFASWNVLWFSPPIRAYLFTICFNQNSPIDNTKTKVIKYIPLILPTLITTTNNPIAFLSQHLSNITFAHLTILNLIINLLKTLSYNFLSFLLIIIFASSLPS